MRPANRRRMALFATACSLLLTTAAVAEPPISPPKAKPSTEAEVKVKAALFGGVPMNRWKEGLLFEGSLSSQQRLPFRPTPRPTRRPVAHGQRFV